MSKTRTINFILELITYNFGHLGFSKWIVDTGEFLNIKIIYIINNIYKISASSFSRMQMSKVISYKL